MSDSILSSGDTNCVLYYPPLDGGSGITFYVSNVEIDKYGIVTKVTGTPLLRLALKLTYAEASLLMDIIPGDNNLQLRWV